ncbi:MAG TPA: FtsQ-type POTRA domain-containing protein, partial [Candidatus Manganitrophaceae bacterium]|nr:FtsQ-type POTRA domain-containing protein [Candidatus Manganitrophaceae bacterium]
RTRRGGPSSVRRLIRAIRVSIRPIGLSILVGVGLFGFYLGFRQLAASPVFEVRALQWSGLQHLKEPEMTALFRPVLGKNLFNVEIVPLQKALLSNRWVKAATVRKDFPDRLTFIIEERTPASVAYPRLGGPLPETTQLLDQDGVVLEQGGAYPPDLPRVVHVNPAAYPKALRLARLLTDRSDFFIDLANPADLQVHLPEGVVHFGEGEYPEKWSRFSYIEDDLRRRGFSRWEADLRFSEKVIVKGDRPKSKKERGEPVHF